MQAVATDGNNSNLGDFQHYNRTELQDIWVLRNSHKFAEPQSRRDGHLWMKDEGHSLTSCREGNVSRIPPRRELQRQ